MTAAAQPAARAPPTDRQDSTDPTDCAESADPTDSQLPTENSDIDEPTLPIEATDPTLPIERNDPSEARDSAEARDHGDDQDRELTRVSVAPVRPDGNPSAHGVPGDGAPGHRDQPVPMLRATADGKGHEHPRRCRGPSGNP